MRIVTDGKVNVACTAGSLPGRGLSLSVAVKAAFKLKNGSPVSLLPEPLDCVGDAHFVEEPSGSLSYASDYVLFKPRADVLLVGEAHSPGGVPVSLLDATLRVGRLRKALRIVGDRQWRRRFLLWSRATAPTAFKSMPIVYERAYGGRKYKGNRVGTG